LLIENNEKGGRTMAMPIARAVRNLSLDLRNPMRNRGAWYRVTIGNGSDAGKIKVSLKKIEDAMLVPLTYKDYEVVVLINDGDDETTAMVF